MRNEIKEILIVFASLLFIVIIISVITIYDGDRLGFPPTTPKEYYMNKFHNTIYAFISLCLIIILLHKRKTK